MDNKIKLYGILKWLCFIPGTVMYIFTIDSFGYMISALCTIIATVAFYHIMDKEQTRRIGLSIAGEIKKAIAETGNVDNLIEIKKVKSGIIARVYLINARERAQIIQRAITNHLSNSEFKRYLWIMQLTDMPGKSFLRDRQRLLNDELIEELTKRKNQAKENRGR